MKRRAEHEADTTSFAKHLATGDDRICQIPLYHNLEHRLDPVVPTSAKMESIVTAIELAAEEAAKYRIFMDAVHTRLLGKAAFNPRAAGHNDGVPRKVQNIRNALEHNMSTLQLLRTKVNPRAVFDQRYIPHVAPVGERDDLNAAHHEADIRVIAFYLNRRDESFREQRLDYAGSVQRAADGLMWSYLTGLDSYSCVDEFDDRVITNMVPEGIRHGASTSTCLEQV